MSKRLEFTCEGLSITVIDEGAFYVITVSRELDEPCLLSHTFAELSLYPRADKHSFEKRFTSPEGLIDWLAFTCIAWRKATSLLAAGNRLRSAGWITAFSDETLEVFRLVDEFALEAQIAPVSRAFSRVNAMVKAYPSSVREALLLRDLLSSEGLVVKSLLPSLVASLPERVLFNCDIPRALTELENVARRAKQKLVILRGKLP